MVTEQQQEQASLYAVGALSADEIRSFEAELRGNAELMELVRILRGTTDLLALAAPQVPLPGSLKQKVLDRIGSKAAPARPNPAAFGIPGFNFIAANDQRGWKELPVRGAWLKLLTIERERGYAVLMGRLEAGVRYPAHSHPGPEELLILTGDLHIGDRKLGPGDFHHADGGTSHPVNHSVDGCTLLAILPADHELVQFAMAS